MRHPGCLAMGLVLPCLVVVSCGSDTPPAPAPADAARDTRAPDAAADAPTAPAPDAPSLPDAADAPDAAPPDSRPPSPDNRPDYASSGLPSVAGVAPAMLATAPAADTDLEVTGADFAADAVVFFAGQMVATTRVSAQKLTAKIPAASVPQPGVYAVQVESGASEARARSNIVYFTLTAAVSGPQILGYTPDNGVPGDVVRMVGKNLTATPVMITGPGNQPVTPGAAERTSWNSASVDSDALPITLPAGWQTGPIVITTPAGSYRGPIFWTGINMGPLGAVAAEASSQYPSAPFFATSARDNSLLTSWYANNGNCASAASCTMGPATFSYIFPALQPIARLAVRGLRDQYRGTWDFVRARFELLDAPGGTPVFIGSFAFPAPERDYDVFFTRPISARVVRFVAEEDLSTSPGLSEIEVFSPDGQGPIPGPDGGTPTPDAGADSGTGDAAINTTDGSPPASR